MFDHLHELAAELERLESELPAIYASGDRRAARDAGRRHAELKPVVDAYARYRSVVAELAEAGALLDAEADAEMQAYLRQEVVDREAARAELESELRLLLLPRDPNEGRNAIVEIQGAAGGDEANLWAGDLLRMYQRFAERHALRVEILSSQPSDHGGYREVTFLVAGEDAWRWFRFEGGPHRVQRVPETESQGRVHTSAATVAVLPEADEVDVELAEHDLEVDVFRASGPGGQSVNTTDSAVRITHVPTGLVVSCQDQKSQLQNKEKAKQILRSRLLRLEQDRQAEAMSSARREQVRSGDRADKIRTYNYKENRVTDHRIGLTLHSLDRVLAGELEPIVDALAEHERHQQLSVAS